MKKFSLLIAIVCIIACYTTNSMIMFLINFVCVFINLWTFLGTPMPAPNLIKKNRWNDVPKMSSPFFHCYCSMCIVLKFFLISCIALTTTLFVGDCFASSVTGIKLLGQCQVYTGSANDKYTYCEVETISGTYGVSTFIDEKVSK